MEHITNNSKAEIAKLC